MKTFLNFLKNSKIILGVTFLISALGLVLAHRPGDSLFVDIIVFFICWISLAAWPLIWKAVILAIIHAFKSRKTTSNTQSPRNNIPSGSYAINNRTNSSRCTESHVFGEAETFRHGDTVFEYQISMDHSEEIRPAARESRPAPANDRRRTKTSPSLQKRRRQVAETLARVIPPDADIAAPKAPTPAAMNQTAQPSFTAASTAPSIAWPANDRHLSQTSSGLQKQRQQFTKTLAKVAEVRASVSNASAAPTTAATAAVGQTAWTPFTAAPTFPKAAAPFTAADPFLPEAKNFSTTVSMDNEADTLRRKTYRNSPLLDKHIAFIGGFQRDRGELTAMVPSVGALFDPAVCESTDFVVLGDTSALAGQPEEAQLQRMNQLYSLTGKPRNITEADYISRIESALRWLEI